MNLSNSVFHFASFATAEEKNQQNKKDNTDTEKPNVTHAVYELR